MRFFIVHSHTRSIILLCFADFCVILYAALPINGKRLAPLHCQGRFLPPDLIERGAAQMSTSEVLQLCLVIIGICSLFVQVYKKK